MTSPDSEGVEAELKKVIKRTSNMRDFTTLCEALGALSSQRERVGELEDIVRRLLVEIENPSGDTIKGVIATARALTASRGEGGGES